MSIETAQSSAVNLTAHDTDQRCQGCKGFLGEGKAYELSGHRWHVECFRCSTCNSLLDSGTNLLLLDNGNLVCGNCSYYCTICHKRIEGTAVLTGDQAFCTDCFVCRNCKRSIKGRKYARTSQGIFCMSCHEALLARKKRHLASKLAAQKKRELENENAEPSMSPKTESSLLDGVLPVSVNSSTSSFSSLSNPSSLVPKSSSDALPTTTKNPTIRRVSSQSIEDKSLPAIPSVLEAKSSHTPLYPSKLGSNTSLSEVTQPGDSHDFPALRPSTTNSSVGSTHTAHEDHLIVPTAGLVIEDKPRSRTRDRASDPVSELKRAAVPSRSPHRPLIYSPTTIPGNDDDYAGGGLGDIIIQLDTQLNFSDGSQPEPDHSSSSSSPSASSPAASTEVTRQETDINDMTDMNNSPMALTTESPTIGSTMSTATTAAAASVPTQVSRPVSKVRPTQNQNHAQAPTSRAAIYFSESSTSVNSSTLTDDLPDHGHTNVGELTPMESSSSSSLSSFGTRYNSSVPSAKESLDGSVPSMNGMYHVEADNANDLLKSIPERSTLRSTSPSSTRTSQRPEAPSTPTRTDRDSANVRTPQPNHSSADYLGKSFLSSPFDLSFQYHASPNATPTSSNAHHQYISEPLLQSSSTNVEPSPERITPRSADYSYLSKESPTTTSVNKKALSMIGHRRSISDKGHGSKSVLASAASIVNGGSSAHQRTSSSGSTKYERSLSIGASGSSMRSKAHSRSASNTVMTIELLNKELMAANKRIAEQELQIYELRSKGLVHSPDMALLDVDIQQKRRTIAELDVKHMAKVKELEVLQSVSDTSSTESVKRQYTAALGKVKANLINEIKELTVERDQLKAENERVATQLNRDLEESSLLNIKNSQLADMNNELTKQLVDKFGTFSAGQSQGGHIKDYLRFGSKSKESPVTASDFSAYAPQPAASYAQPAVNYAGPLPQRQMPASQQPPQHSQYFQPSQPLQPPSQSLPSSQSSQSSQAQSSQIYANSPANGSDSSNLALTSPPQNGVGDEPPMVTVLDGGNSGMMDSRKMGGNRGRFWKRPGAAVAKGFNKVFATEGDEITGNGTTEDGYAPPARMSSSISVPSGMSNIGEGLVSSTSTTGGLGIVFPNGAGSAQSANTSANGSANVSGAANATVSNGAVASSKTGKGTKGGWFRHNDNSAALRSLSPSRAAPGAKETSSLLIGVALEERNTLEGNRIPLIVTLCIQEVEKRGMDFEGIYRKSGAVSQRSAIEEAFEKRWQGDFSSELSVDISAVTSALKQYFRYLPDPLITFDRYDEFIRIGQLAGANGGSSAGYANDMRSVICGLSSAHRDCLEYLIRHLKRVTEHSAVNLMTSKNLAVCFAPTIARDLDGSREMVDMTARNDATQILIDCCEEVFNQF